MLQELIVDIVKISISMLLLVSPCLLLNNSMTLKYHLNKYESNVTLMSLFALFLLVFINLANFFGGYQIFFVFYVLSTVYITFNFRKVNRNIVFEIGVFLFLIVTSVIFIVKVFKLNEFWLLEGSNHDSLFYFEGVLWHLKDKLFVNNEYLFSKWGINGHSLFIGYESALQRQGEYVLTGYLLSLVSTMKAGYVYFIYIFTVIFNYLIINLFFSNASNWRKVFLTLLLSLTNGLILSLVNSNLPTLVSASSICIAISILFVSDKINLKIKYISISLWLALITHLYGESLFYIGFILIFIFTKDLIVAYKDKTLKKLLLLFFISLLFFILSTNIALFVTLKSLLTISDATSSAGFFPTYFLNAPIYKWIGGLLHQPIMGYYSPQTTYLIFSSIVIFICCFVLIVKRFNFVTISILALTVFLVIFIETINYSYGEHKLLQLLGPIWAIVLMYTLAVLEREGKGHLLPLIILVLFSIINIRYALKASRYLTDSILVHSISDDITGFVEMLPQGSNVIIDDFGFNSVSKYQKGHYLAFELLRHNINPLMSSMNNDILRGGYLRGQLGSSLNSSEKEVQYLIVSRSVFDRELILGYDNTVLIEGHDFVLLKLKLGEYIVLDDYKYEFEGNGFWVGQKLSIIYNTVSSGFIEIDLSPFNIKEDMDNYIDIYIDDKKVKTVTINIEGVTSVMIPVVNGKHELKLKPKWKLKSPFDISMNNDTRKLSFFITRIGYTHDR